MSRCRPLRTASAASPETLAPGRSSSLSQKGALRPRTSWKSNCVNSWSSRPLVTDATVAFPAKAGRAVTVNGPSSARADARAGTRNRHKIRRRTDILVLPLPGLGDQFDPAGTYADIEPCAYGRSRSFPELIAI